tara:strand:+ start:318 stop:635 length:318 start_codon:yes stop_codon:yes gene_type:complete
MIIGFGLCIAACDDFVRFRTEKYACDTNRLGLQSIELQTQRGKTVATLVSNGQESALDIVMKDKQLIELKAGKAEFIIARETGEIRALLGARYALLTCKKIVFSM